MARKMSVLSLSPYLCLDLYVLSLIYLVVDSWARFPFSGLLDGTNSDYGEYDQCLAISHREDDLTIDGMHCMALLSLPLPAEPKKLSFHNPIIQLNWTEPMDSLFQRLVQNVNLFYITKGFRLGVCLPNTCSAHDLQSICDKSSETFSHILYMINYLLFSFGQLCRH